MTRIVYSTRERSPSSRAAGREAFHDILTLYRDGHSPVGLADNAVAWFAKTQQTIGSTRERARRIVLFARFFLSSSLPSSLSLSLFKEAIRSAPDGGALTYVAESRSRVTRSSNATETGENLERFSAQRGATRESDNTRGRC